MKSTFVLKRSLQLAINETRLLGMLGFAMRAGKLIIGTESVCRAMAKGTPKLVLVSDAASEGTKKKLTVKCEFYGIPHESLPLEADKIGALLGKTYAPAVIGVCDDGFAREIDAAMASRNNDTERKFPPRGNR